MGILNRLFFGWLAGSRSLGFDIDLSKLLQNSTHGLAFCICLQMAKSNYFYVILSQCGHNVFSTICVVDWNKPIPNNGLL